MPVMRLCSWCLSDKATRSDDENDSNSIKATSESATSSLNAQKTAAATAQSSRHARAAAERTSTATSVFEQYAEEDDPNVIGPEGLERLCESAEIPMDGALPLLLAWISNSKEMGKITRAEWMGGMSDYGCVTVLRISELSR